jgi:hypothetical protein
LLVNGTIVDSVVVPELVTGSSYTLSYLWTPTVEGIYNVTAYVPPVPNEEFTRNNIASTDVLVRYLIARVAVLNSWDMPPYFAGGWSNNYQLLVDALNARGFYAQAVTNEEIIGGTLSFFDVFVMVDNVPNDAAVPCVVDFWSNGGGIVAFDSSICFLCYAGILPPESYGSNGYYVYWDYETSYQARIAVEHPITAGYEVGQIVYGTSGDAEYRVDALAGTSAYPYYTMLVEDVTRPNRAYVSVYEPPMSGRVVHIWDQNHWSNTDLQLMILNAMEWAKTPRYEHDLTVSLVVPASLELGETTILNATVRNTGLNNETDVALYLLINSTVVSSATIPELQVNEFYTINYLWTPTETGKYNVTAYAPPVPGEEYTANNVITKKTMLFFYRRFYFPHEWVGGGIPMGWHADDSSWQYTLPFDFPFYGINYRTIYISSNGLITFIGPDNSYVNSIPTLADKLAISPAWDDWTSNEPYDIYIWEDSIHVGIRWNACDAFSSSKIVNFEAILSINGVIQFNYEHNNGSVSTTIGISNGAGHILAEDVTSLDCINTIVFTPYLLMHDVAVINVKPSKTIVAQGYSVNINVTVANKGYYTETFNVTVYANITSIASQTLTLDSGNCTTLTFSWNTSGFAMDTYTIIAEAEVVEGETYTENNRYTDGVITVSVIRLGDFDGDSDVDEDDTWQFCAYFITYSKSGYKPKMVLFDFDGDFDVDEDDLWTFCVAFINYYKST